MSSGSAFEDENQVIADKLVRWLTEYTEYYAEISAADDPMESLQKVVGDCAAQDATSLKKVQVLEGLVALLRSADSKLRNIDLEHLK